MKYLLASHAGDNLGEFRHVRLVYDDELMILENPRALPRVLFVPTWE